jgi:hypothetical protein
MVWAAMVMILVASPGDAQPRERLVRALDVVDELKLSDATMSRLLPLVKAYDREREALLAKDVDLLSAIRLTTDSAALDKLLDQRLAVQRTLLAKEQKLVRQLRAMLKPQQAARARVVLLGVDFVESGVPMPAPVEDAPRGTDLFPPGSPIAVDEPTPRRHINHTCDPFASMHGCR